MVCYVFLSNKYPKIAKKSVRPFLLVKHSVPTLTDETKVTICVEKEITGMFFTGDKNQSASTPRSNRGVRCFGDPRSGCALYKSISFGLKVFVSFGFASERFLYLSYRFRIFESNIGFRIFRVPKGFRTFDIRHFTFTTIVLF